MPADRMKLSRFFLSLAFLLPATLGWGEDRKPEKKDTPKVLVAIPLGVSPGTTAKVTIRGLKLDTASVLKFPDSKATAKILSKGNAPVPDKNPEKVGDTQVQAEINVPEGVPAGSISFVVVTATGETQPHRLLVEDKTRVIAEKEPNNGFREAQSIQVGQVIDGMIDPARDVDVFRLEGQAGQRVAFEVLAARHGSALDSILTLYDDKGQELASNDDTDGSADSRLEVTLPRQGSYFLSLMDAHDAGGPVHVYRLVSRLAK